jgi:hypothetical protein
MTVGDSDDEHEPMEEAVLRLELYPEGADLHRSDQITVPTRTWQNLYHGHEGGERPLFVDVRAGADQWRPLVARLRPAGVGELADDHVCRVPEWMWLLLGAPEAGTWVTLAVTTVADVGVVVLRPRRREMLEGGDDPVTLLTAALTGSGGEASWAVLCAGAELPLWCGVFDVVGLRSLGGTEMAVGCILDHDVTLELEPALDTPVARPPTPPPSPLPLLLPSVAVPPPVSVASGGMSFPGMSTAATATPPTAATGRRRGYVPFGGTGHTLGSH